MLDILAFIVGALGFISTWRALVGVGISLALGLSFVPFLPPGAPRVLGLVSLVVVGMCLGGLWQASHERKVRSSRAR